MTDPYAILGVPRSATEDEIRSAYRRLAKRYHPDVPGGSDAKFVMLVDAYEFCHKNVGQPFTQEQPKGSPEPEPQWHDVREPGRPHTTADAEEMFREKMAQMRANPKLYEEELERFRRELHKISPMLFLWCSIREEFALPWRDLKNSLNRRE